MPEVVQGDPVYVRGHELVALVRVETHVRRQAILAHGVVSGRGWGGVRLRPIAIIDRGSTGERRLPIHDGTAQLIGGLLLAALIIPLLLLVALRLARKGSD